MLKTNRSIIIHGILMLITGGFYHLWFVYTAARDANIICGFDGRKTPGLFVYLVLSALTLGLYHIFWIYQLSERMSDTCLVYKLSPSESGLTVVLWQVVGSLIFIGPLVAAYIIIKNLNQLSLAYNMSCISRL